MMNPMASNTDIQLLRCGVEFFPALIAAINEAKHEIFLETYIFFDDATGEVVASALAQASRRGVSTHLIIDGFGSKEYPKTKLDALKQAGVKLLIYRPSFLNFRFLRTGLRRLHRKLAVIDHQVAFVGGINIHHDFEPGYQKPRYDFAVAVRGSVVADVLNAVTHLWWLLSWSQLKSRHVRRVAILKPASSTPASSSPAAELVLRDNLRNRHTIEVAYLEAIKNATERIIIANAYFLPGKKLLQALVDAAGRGVSVALLLQGRVEYFLQHHASQYLYGKLIDAGVEIHLYKPAILHAKVAVIDSRWVTVGSSNMDPFSLQLAREANIVAEDAALAKALADDLLAAIQSDASRITVEAWHSTPLRKRLLMRICYAVLRFTQQLVAPNKRPRVP